MKPFMLRHKLGWLPNKLEYRRTYITGFKVNNNKEMVVRNTI